MEASLKLGRIRGIVVGIHYSWLIIFGLLTYSLAEWFFPVVYGDWSATRYWVVAAIASLLLFASVLAHELGHSFVAQSKGIPVRSITLFVFGGVASIERDTERPGDEFRIAIAGPLVSALIGGISLALLLLAPVPDAVAAILEYLTWANLVLAVFNLVPGYPLDGGRVLRAVVWAMTDNRDRATRIAARAGVVVGYLFMLGGVVYALALNSLVSGIWLAAIGWFLRGAAEQSYQQVALENAFRGVRVGSLMDPTPAVIRPDTSLDNLVENYVLARNVRAASVVENGELIGIITLVDLRDVPRSDWSRVSVRDRMTPRAQMATATSDTPIESALRAMSQRDIHQIPVLQGNVLVGLLTRGAVIRYLQIREELPEARTRSASPLSPWGGRRRDTAV